MLASTNACTDEHIHHIYMHIPPHTHTRTNYAIRFPNFNMGFSYIQTETGKHKNCLEDYVGTNKSTDLWLLNGEMKEKARGTSWHGAPLPSLTYQEVGRKQKQDGVTTGDRGPLGSKGSNRFKKCLSKEQSPPLKKGNGCPGYGWRRGHTLHSTHSPMHRSNSLRSLSS